MFEIRSQILHARLQLFQLLLRFAIFSFRILIDLALRGCHLISMMTAIPRAGDNRPHISSPMLHVLAQHAAAVSRSAQLLHRPVVAYTKTVDDQYEQDK